MPNRAVQSRNTMIDLLTRVPVNRGGLIKSIDHLLKTIETSENAVMIPTLLKDKVRVDAWELLFVAKILKASVLGHSDLVEFYLNHIHNNSSHAGAAAAAAGTPVDELPPQLSPQPSPLLRQQSSPAMGASPVLARHNLTNNNHASQPPVQPPLVEGLVLQTTTSHSTIHEQSQQKLQGSHSSTSSVASSNATATSGCKGTSPGSSTSKQSSSVSWTTATANSTQQQQQQQQIQATIQSGASLSSSPFTSACNSATTSGASSSASSSDGGVTCTTTTVTSQQQNGICPVPPPRVATFQISDCSPPAASPNGVETTTTSHVVAVDSGTPVKPTAAATPAAVVPRQPQPPSLLQLTTTNNHINSVSEMFNTNSPLSPSLEQLTNHLFQLQLQSQQQQQQLTPDQVPLSISTSAPAQNGLAPVSEHPTPNGSGGGGLQPQSAATTPNAAASGGTGAPSARHELRSSRSAGCLFRANSGASSPRTPGTPFPQAETLAGTAPTGLVGDPSSLVKLLLQVEQLKTSIVQVTSLLDSVVELYKKSIDNIAT